MNLKNIARTSILCIAVIVSFLATARATQLSGSYTIDPSATASATVFNDFASAVIYMTGTGTRPDGGTSNSGTVGVSGAVTFNVTAGTTYTLSSALVIPAVTGASSGNTITFKKNGSAANPIIYGYKGTGTADGVVIFLGASYITFDGIDIRDNAANTTTTTQMEWGYALLRTSTPVGSQYNTIQNCNIALNRSNTNTVGIYGDCYSWSSGSLTSVSVSGPSGANSYNKIYSNTISNCFTPIFIRGYSSGSANYVDLGNDVGSKGGNTVSSFGYLGNSCPYQNPYTGAYVNGIMLYQQGDTYYINNNTVTLTAADNVSTIINGISSVAWNVAVTGSNPVIKNNTVYLVSRAIASAFTGIANNQGTSTSIEDVENNVVTGINDTATGAANFIGINIQSTIPSGKYIYNNNEIKNCRISGTGYFYGISTAGGGNPTSPFSFSGNKIHDNIRSNGTNNCGNTYGIYNVAGTSTEDIHDNIIYNLSTSSGSYVDGIYSNNTCTTRNIYNDSIANFSAPNGFIHGIRITAGNTTNIYRNKIYLQKGGFAGIYLYKVSMPSSAPGTIYNNFISMGGTLGYSYGIYDVATTNHSVYFNNILITNTYHYPKVVNIYAAGVYLNNSTSGAGVIYENNNFINTAGGHAIIIADPTGISKLDYNNYYTSGYLGLWKSTPCTTITDWRSSSSLDAHSLSFDALYKSTSDLHARSAALARAGVSGTGISTDIDGIARHSSPTIGANELNPYRTDIAITTINGPTYGNCGDSNTVISVNVANFGTDTAYNPIVYAQIKGTTGSASYIDTIKTKLAYDSVVTVKFPKTLNTSAGGTWTFKVYTAMKNDSDRTNDTLYSVVTMNSRSPQPAVFNNAICKYGSMKIAAIPYLKTDSIYWYSSPAGGIFLGSGDTLKTPSISKTTSYFAQARMPVNSYYAGPKSNTIGSTSLSMAASGFKFNALTFIKIDSATVYPAASGSITVSLLDSFGKLMRSVLIPISSSSPGAAVRVPIGLLVSPGNGYLLTVNDTQSSGLYFNTSGAVYPYKVNNIISILNPIGGSSSSTNFSGLYNLRVSTGNCPSQMTTVTATIASPGLTVSNDVNSFGKLNAGTVTSPDRVCASNTMIYDLVTTMGNSNYGTTWTISSKSLITPKGTPSKDTSSVPPSLKGAGKFIFSPKIGSSDSIYILKITIKTLGKLSCDSTISRYVYVSPLPKAKYGFINACQNNPIIFTDSSTISSGKVAGWTWDFGDGQSSTLQNTSHVYAVVGKHLVTLTAISDFGCQASITRTAEQYPFPIAKFGAASGCQNHGIVFTDSSSIITGSIISRKWYFGDGAVSTVINPTHIYTKSGYYNVKLVISSSFGCKDSLTKKIRIMPAPVVAFSYSNACVGSQFYFANKTFDSTTGTVYLWDFGDKTTSSAVAPSHIYQANGTYYAKLTATTKYGCYDTAVQTITPYSKPVVNFYATHACTGHPVSFTDSGNNASNSLYTWNFGDGSAAYTSKNISASHIYTKSGLFSVGLSIQSPAGCTDSEMLSITVSDLPKPGFTALDVCKGKATQFTNTSTPTAGLIYKWNPGDGTPDITTQNPSHLYKNAGTYTVTLLVTNGNGCSDSISKTVNIIALPILGKWTATIHNYTVSFKPQDTTQKSYKWYFGTGDSSALKQPVYTYPATQKTYLVRLVETNTAGCTGSLTDSLFMSGTGMDQTAGDENNISIFPNPFENKTTLRYVLKHPGLVRISIHDLQGRLIANLKEGNFASGIYNDDIDAGRFKMPEGIYLVKIAIDGTIWTGRIVVIR